MFNQEKVYRFGMPMSILVFKISIISTLKMRHVLEPDEEKIEAFDRSKPTNNNREIEIEFIRLN